MQVTFIEASLAKYDRVALNCYHRTWTCEWGPSPLPPCPHRGGAGARGAHTSTARLCEAGTSGRLVLCKLPLLTPLVDAW